MQNSPDSTRKDAFAYAKAMVITMKILALDSSAQIAGVALCEEAEPLCLIQNLSGHTHSETLLPMVISALEGHGLTPGDIDLFACNVGPGSYTGIRIGVATVKGLASGSGKPCVAVSSLESLAENCTCFEGLICPVMDARRDQMYTALFESRNGKTERLTEDALLPLEEIGRQLRKIGGTVHFAGDGYEKTLAALNYGKAGETPMLLRRANAYSTALCALRKYRAQPEKNYDEGLLSPVYLRATQAERERLEREKTKVP